MGRNKVVVITGASSGIGRATALRFAKQKAHLVLASRRGTALAALADECEALGARAIAVPTDTSDEAQVDALGQAAVSRFGRIDVWVNDAAISVFSPFLEMPSDDFRRVIDVNVMGYVYGSKAALRAMTTQGSGVLINVASIVGEIPQPYTAPYGMSKAAVRALGVSLRQELWITGQKKIRVSTILPATIDTNFFQNSGNYTGREVVAMPPVYPADKVAKAIVDAAKAPRDEVTVGAAGKAMVHQHRLTPGPVEVQMAVQVEKTHLSRQNHVADTRGAIYEPRAGGEATVSGGWHGGRRFAVRRLLTWSVLAGAGVAAWRVLRASDAELPKRVTAALAKSAR